ncbi:hypothetical protein [Enterococcus faecalis]|uniref:hypothetical protein n=1 Tax=Enterococcus faecalis TaxID=1351 RepID=UPI003D13F1FE
MNKYEIEKRLCEELDIEFLHLDLQVDPSYLFTEEEYQEFKADYAQLFSQLESIKKEK